MQSLPSTEMLGAAIVRGAQPLEDEETLVALEALTARTPFVLLGESTHGTHEFYATRAAITQQLIRAGRCDAVAVEADWPEAYRVNRYVRGRGDDRSAEEALGDFKRFPRWMWRNAEVLEFVAWLRAHNESLPEKERVGFYGVDLFSLHTSMERVVSYLESVDPEAARRARERYACFEIFDEDPQTYGRTTAFGLSESCEREVVRQLEELRERRAREVASMGLVAGDKLFDAKQNARLAMNAERYYRAMYQGNVSSWNIRDRHMTETIEALHTHLMGQRGQGRLAVWEHNSHLGDARHTQMGLRGEVNVGQLLRERHGEDTVLIGYTTYTGTVAAAAAWNGPVQHRRVRPALEGSFEHLFHAYAPPRCLLNFRENATLAQALAHPRLQRAIGVVYRPETERQSHYYAATISRQFDAVIHLDETRALDPLDRGPAWSAAPGS